MSFTDRLAERLTHGFERLREHLRPHEEPPAEMPEEIKPIHALLGTINDPELACDLVNLGLVRSITLTEGHVDVVMTLTTRGCPAAKFIAKQVEDAIAGLGYTAAVELVFDPPWTVDDITPEGRRKLGR